MKQDIAAVRVCDEDVHAAIAVEVTEHHIARVAAAGKPEARRGFGEGSVETVAVHGARAVANEQQIEIAVVVEVHEHCLARSPYVGDSGFRRYVLECSVAAIAKEVTAPFTANDKEVKPAIVVVVREGRERGALRKGDARALGGVAHESTLHMKEMGDGPVQRGRPHRDEDVVRPVAIGIARGQRSRSVLLRRCYAACTPRIRDRESSVARGIAELDGRHRRSITYASAQNERRWRKGQDRTSGDGTFRPFHVLQRRLIWCRDLHQRHEAAEDCPRLAKPSCTEELNGTVEIRDGLLGRFGRYSSHLLKVSNGTVSIAAPHQRIHEPQSRGEVCWNHREHVSEPVAVPASGRAIGLLRFEVSECVQHVCIASTIATQPLQHLARVGRTCG